MGTGAVLCLTSTNPAHRVKSNGAVMRGRPNNNLIMNDKPLWKDLLHYFTFWGVVYGALILLFWALISIKG